MNTSELQGRRILLVDDEHGVREILAMVLELHGAEVTQAAHARQALELYGQHPFDAVVTDYNMPGMRGDALAETVKKRRPTQRVIMVTAFAENVLRNGVLPWFLDALCLKPCSMADLVAAVRT
jgi:CheY-like chemotaxis protein